MFRQIRWWWEGFILRQWRKYYTVGGHCGLCGRWVPNAVVDKDWTWTLCEDAGEENACYHRSVTSVKVDDNEV